MLEGWAMEGIEIPRRCTTPMPWSEEVEGNLEAC
jgi:hypothetical protein